MIDPFLRCFEPVVDAIADFLGPNCEVILHDISDLEHSIIKIRNGHVTGRKVGDSMTDMGLKLIKEAKHGATLQGNRNLETKNGKTLKSNSVILRTPKGMPVGMICINLDVDAYVRLERTIRDFYKVEDRPESEVLGEHFDGDIWIMLDDSVRAARGEHANHDLTKEMRKRIIGELDKKGLFFIRSAVLRTARSLGISQATVYKYLQEIRLPSDEAQVIDI